MINFSSVSSFSNFDVVYFDLSHRWTLVGAGVRPPRLLRPRRHHRTRRSIAEERQQAIQQTGVQGAWIYPFSLYHRVSAGAGYIFQKANYLTGKGTVERRRDPGARDRRGRERLSVPARQPWSATARSSPSTDRSRAGAGGSTPSTPSIRTQSGALYTQYELDVRQYLAVSQRSNLALRLYAGYAGGNQPIPLYFGGLDDLRGVDFRSMIGDRAFYTNIEYRFPLIDLLATPVLNFRSVRGRVFLDVGGAWFEEFGQDFDFLEQRREPPRGRRLVLRLRCHRQPRWHRPELGLRAALGLQGQPRRRLRAPSSGSERGSRRGSAGDEPRSLRSISSAASGSTRRCSRSVSSSPPLSTCGACCRSP